MTQAERIIRKFGDERGRGGVTRLAALLGHRHASTVGNWLLRGRIPLKWWDAVIAAALSAGIALSRDDFFAQGETAAEAAPLAAAE